MRPIDADALLAVLNAGKCSSNSWNAGVDHAINSVRSAPTLQPEGDAISRDALLERIRTISSYMPPLGEEAVKRDALANEIKHLPAIPVAAPDVDVVTVEEVVEGIEWVCGGLRKRVVRTGSSWADVTFLDGSEDQGAGAEPTFSKASVAAMLNVAESATWPVGHPRNPKPKVLTLLEAAERVSQLLKNVSDKRAEGYAKILDDAIEREKGKEETE